MSASSTSINHKKVPVVKFTAILPHWFTLSRHPVVVLHSWHTESYVMNNITAFDSFIPLFETAILKPAAVTPLLSYSPIFTGDLGRKHLTSVRSTSFPG